MASKQEELVAFSVAYEDDTPTPTGWKRKLVPRIGNSLIPLRTDVIFVTPGGEEFTSRAQLQRYLKANKGSPSISEFIWIVDEFPQRSTRSKSTHCGEVQKVELPLKLASKKKLAKVASAKEVEGTNKLNRGTEKIKEPMEEELPAAKGKRARPVVSADTQSERESEIKAFMDSPPVSPKRKRSVKNTKKAGAGVTGAKPLSVDTNGEADLGKKDEPEPEPEPVEDETAEKPKQASKKSASKARTARGGRRKGAKKVAIDDTKDETGDENAADDTKDEARADSGGDGSHGAEKVSADITAEDGTREAAASDQENHLAESNA